MQNQDFDIETDVIISGAGPTGLTLACLLGRWDIPYYIIDKNSNLSKESKAFNLHTRTLEIFDQLGIAEQALKEGDTDSSFHILRKGKTVANLNLSKILPQETSHPYFLILPQNKTEHLLYNLLQSQNNKVFWEHELIQFEERDDFLAATVNGPSGEVKKIRSKYIVGCDGASSTVRKLSEFKYEGKTYAPTFYLTDAKMNWKYPHGDGFFSLTKDHFTVFSPFREKNKYRIFNFMNTALKKNEDDKLTLEDIQLIVDSNPYHDIQVEHPEWFSIFKLHSRLPEAFCKGRVILAGDAASVHSPVGGQGMNTGIQDSYNLAWKLALVLKELAEPQLLKSYNEERRQIALNLHKTTDRLFNLMTKQTKFAGFFRSNIFPFIFKLISSIRPLREKVMRRFSQIAIKYRFSSINLEGDMNRFRKKSPKAGDRAPYTKFSINNQETDTAHLFDCDRFTVLIAIVDSEGQQINWVQKQLSKFSAVPMKVHIISASNGGAEFHKTYGTKKNALFIIRPDGHIGFRSSQLTDDGVVKYFEHILGDY